MSVKPIFLGLASLIALSFYLYPSAADACGGLFCSASAPVNQAAERIIFSKNDDGTVTAVVQIQYEGPSEEFAWVLPVPGIPDVKVSSDAAFTRLQLASNPRYTLNTEIEGECSDGDQVTLNGNRGSSGAGGGGGSGGEPVVVLDQGNVGPYDYVVVQPTGAFEHVGDVMVEWLTNEGYDVVPPGGDPDDISALLGSYLEEEMNLIAFRLTKGNDAGTIRPIRITYPSEQPMIPIRPTAVAVNDDMGVMVWVLGRARAVPLNYRSLELNEALIDWLRGGTNYNEVVIAAANQAGGQGFVTERAGPSADYEDTIVQEWERETWQSLVLDAPTLSSEQVLRRSVQLSSWDAYRDVVERFIPVDEVENFISCPACGSVISPFDKDAFLAALATEVVEPMFDTQSLIDAHPYVTRFYTTLSAPEMDLDPTFAFNADLEPVSNTHFATRVFECNPSIFLNEAPSRIELDDGRVVRLPPGMPWPFAADGPDAPPANAIVTQLTTSGLGRIVADNGEAIDQALASHNAQVLTLDDMQLQGRGGCAVTGNRGDLLAWIVLSIGVLLLVRRRGAV